MACGSDVALRAEAPCTTAKLGPRMRSTLFNPPTRTASCCPVLATMTARNTRVEAIRSMVGFMTLYDLGMDVLIGLTVSYPAHKRRGMPPYLTMVKVLARWKSVGREEIVRTSLRMTIGFRSWDIARHSGRFMRVNLSGGPIGPCKQRERIHTIQLRSRRSQWGAGGTVRWRARLPILLPLSLRSLRSFAANPSSGPRLDRAL